MKILTRTLFFPPQAYRPFGKNDEPLLDLMIRADMDPVPEPQKRYFCRHPFVESKRVYVTPTRVEKLSSLVWDGKNGLVRDIPSIQSVKEYVHKQLSKVHR